MTRDPKISRSQSDRSSAMRQRLIDACIESLIDVGYARTTTVEVCQRAGVTRGALLHHFASLPALLADTLRTIYSDFFSSDIAVDSEQGSETATLLRIIWSRIGRRDFKAVIELWLAAKNDEQLAQALAPVIDEFSKYFAPEQSMPDSGNGTAFRLAIETMIGLALGRAINQSGEPVAHEQAVLDLLIEWVDRANSDEHAVQ